MAMHATARGLGASSNPPRWGMQWQYIRQPERLRMAEEGRHRADPRAGQRALGLVLVGDLHSRNGWIHYLQPAYLRAPASERERARPRNKGPLPPRRLAGLDVGRGALRDIYHFRLGS